jgi:hypothetical protein
MQLHTTTNKGCWDFGDTGLAVYRKYAKLHTDLFPYIYALNAEAARSGMPIMRPLPLLYRAGFLRIKMVLFRGPRERRGRNWLRDSG